MAKKHFHIMYDIIAKNKENAEGGNPDVHEAPMRIMFESPDERNNRMFYEVVILGQDGLPAATISYNAGDGSPGNTGPNRITVRAGLWTNGAVIVDGVRIE